MDQAINHIIFLYWNNQISQEQMLEYLQDVPPKILAEWIDSLVNRIDDAMKFATLSDRVEYPEGRVLPEKDIHERILEAAKRFCLNGSIKNWTAGKVMEARAAGLIEDYEYWSAVRIADEMSRHAQSGKRKFY